ncbi:MAG: antimicrobial peptide transporter, permease component [Paenibacillaceae bacterium]|jgi:putative ABC transport system permease protein|nr:antimicrobial peptide transporter, permease component [Paenibacillaceae bacterium]
MLFRKMLRDMLNNKMQFISIFLMAFLGVGIFTGIGGEWRGLQETVDDYYEQTRLADIVIYGNSYSIEDIDKLTAIPGVTAAQRRLTLETIGSFDNKPVITLHIIEENSISRPQPVSGSEFSPGLDGVWLDERFAAAKGLRPGDSITFSFNGMTLTKPIQGTVYGPEHVFFVKDGDLSPNFANMGYGYLPAGALPRELDIPYNELLVSSGRGDLDQLEKEAAAALSGRYSVFLPQADNTSVSMFQNEIRQHQAMGSVFPVAFIAIAILTILTTMTRLVNSQRTQIGTLKAMGFSSRIILGHYVSYGFWISLLGSFLGAAVGPLTLPRLFFPSLSAYYTLPQWKSAQTPLFYLVAGLAVLACTLTTLWACGNVLKDTPAGTLRPKAPKAVKQGGLEKLALWKKASFNLKWNLRDITRNKIRSGMAVIGVLSCTALLVCAFGMQDSMNDVARWQYQDINRFETKLTVDKTATAGQTAAVIQSVNGQALMEAPIEIKAGETKKTGTATITDQVTLMKNTDKSRRYIELPADGVSISYKMADLLGVKEGDEITWHLYGEENWITSRIAAVYRTPTSQGISLTKEHFADLAGSFTPTSILSAGKATGEFPGISGVWSASELADSWEDTTEAMNLMVYVLIFCAVLLAVVVLYNLGLLFFTEKERELATLKVIGFQARQLRGLLLTQNVWLSVIGILAGIPCGKWLIDVMIATMGDSFDMMTVVSLSSMLTSILIALSLSVAVNLMFSGRIKRVDMVGSLKGVE